MVEPSGGQGEANSIELTLRFANLRLERSDPRDRFDLLLGVVADFSLEIGRQSLYSEPDFPVVEFAEQLQSWCAEGLRSGEDFKFTSMESDASGLVWFRQAGGGYRVGSCYQDVRAMQVYGSDELRSSIRCYIAELRERSKREHGIDLDPILGT